MLDEPLTNVSAKKLIAAILENGTTSFSVHARAELAKDSLSTTDAVNVLRGGVVEPAEFENGSWRYPIRTPRMLVVVAFRSETEMRVVTAWRLR